MRHRGGHALRRRYGRALFHHGPVEFSLYGRENRIGGGSALSWEGAIEKGYQAILAHPHGHEFQTDTVTPSGHKVVYIGRRRDLDTHSISQLIEIGREKFDKAERGQGRL